MTPVPDETLKSDLAVIRRCIEPKLQDENAPWQAFVDQFGPAIRHWIRQTRRTGSRQDHEDLFQIVLSNLYEGRLLEDFDAQLGNPRAWLRTVVRNTVWQIHRREYPERNRTNTLVEDLALLADHSSARDVLEMLGIIGEYIASIQLTEPILRIFNKLLNGETPEEVATDTGLSLASIYRYRAKLISHGRSALGVEAAKKAD